MAIQVPQRDLIRQKSTWKMEVTKDGGPKREERVLEDFLKEKKKNYKKKLTKSTAGKNAKIRIQ